MCLVLPKEDVDDAISIVEKHDKKAFILGHAKKDEDQNIVIKQYRIRGTEKEGTFSKY